MRQAMKGTALEIMAGLDREKLKEVKNKKALRKVGRENR